MSLSLIQSYSSAEEDEQQESLHHYHDFSDNDDDSDTEKNDEVSRFPSSYNPVIAPKSSTSALPSAIVAFSEISGPPQFLNNCVEEEQNVGRNIVAHRGRKKSREKKDLPSGAVVEAKPNLVGIHERVRSDIEGKASSTTSAQPPKAPSTTNDGSQPSMCLQCGIPKIYSSALGTVCPVCSDDSKKKGSTVKDKEKVKRMKGQSSHASWKSETEMHLRQHYD
ncbi:movement protein [Bienertia sinuspersici]